MSRHPALSSPLRDCQAWRDDGLCLSTVSNEAAKHFDMSIRQYISWAEDDSTGGLQSSLSQMMIADANFIMGKVLTLGLDVLSTGRSVRKDVGFANELKELEKTALLSTSISEREFLHVKALLLWSEGYQPESCELWESILQRHPTDILALKFVYDSYFFLGDQRQIRDTVARVLPSWNKSMPLYSYLKGMYAFGLEENNIYPLAEKEASEALHINRRDAWATHAIAHVYEMENRVDYGIKFLEGTEKDWSVCNLIACHNYWHLCLYYIEKGDYEVVLQIINDHIGPGAKGGVMLDIVDLISVLYRLKLEGVQVKGDLWDLAQDLCQRHLHDHILAFNEAHFAMAFAGCGRTHVVEQYLTSLQSYVSSEHRSHGSKIIAKYGTKIVNAIIAFESRDYGTVVDLLFPIRLKFSRIGGSHAQRDIFDQLLLHSTLLSPNKHHLAKALLNERKMQKSSLLTERLITRFLNNHLEQNGH